MDDLDSSNYSPGVSVYNVSYSFALLSKLMESSFQSVYEISLSI